LVYSESYLVLPALRLLRDSPRGLHTSELVEKLEQVLKPTGRDVELLEGRSDNVFSQKVRNLKSHDTLVKKGLATFEEKEDTRGGVHQITKEGLDYLQEAEPIEKSLEYQGFDVDNMNEEYKQDLTEIVIEEGQLTVSSSKQRTRSQRLRTEAINKFKTENDGQLTCGVCGFDFKENYGKLGEDFIIIHHIEPVHCLDIEGEKTTLDKAFEKVAPLCSNCHSMIHRGGKLLSVEDLKRIVAQQKDLEGDAM
jgi:predicted HNH restriction endonuclease